MSTIKDTFELTPVVPWKTSKAKPLDCPAPHLLYGLEVELENCVYPEEMVISGMTRTDDGSLRNCGQEFILKPMTYSNVAQVLGSFWGRNNINSIHVSERCSVHVHVNCQDLTFDQLAPILLLYQVMEPLFFTWVGDERDKNIFCVPWSETLITANSLATVRTSFRDWYKYTALNLRPLHDQGTIEFRHLGGQKDFTRILTWMCFIGCLFAYCEDKTLMDVEQEVLALNSNSFYLGTLNKVFKQWAMELIQLPQYEQALEKGVLAAKYCVLQKYQKKSKTKDKMSRMILDELDHNVDAMRWARIARGGVLGQPFEPVLRENRNEQVNPAPARGPRHPARRFALRPPGPALVEHVGLEPDDYPPDFHDEYQRLVEQAFDAPAPEAVRQDVNPIEPILNDRELF
jgi:hypothetical protein